MSNALKCDFKGFSEYGIIIRVVDIDVLKSVLGRESVLLLNVWRPVYLIIIFQCVTPLDSNLQRETSSCVALYGSIDASSSTSRFSD